MDHYYPTFPEFHFAVSAAPAPSEVCRFVEIKCVEGSCDRPAGVFGGVSPRARYSHLTLKAKRFYREGVCEWRWQIIFPPILRHPEGLFRIKKGAILHQGQISLPAFGFEVRDLDPYEEHKGGVAGPTYVPRVDIGPSNWVASQ